jgi:hypothetical protein
MSGLFKIFVKDALLTRNTDEEGKMVLSFFLKTFLLIFIY